MKRYLMILCCCLLGFPACACSQAVEIPEGEILIDTGDTPEYVEWLLQIARGELGYVEGAGSYTKYGEWAGNPNAEWCAEFVCWCVDQVDRQYGTELSNHVYPIWGGMNVGRNWFVREGRFVYRKGNCPEWGYQWERGADHYLKKNEYIPHPGDLLFFSYNEAGDTAHVAIVEYSSRMGDGTVMIHVIEGNNPDRVQRNSYKLDNSQILGFGTPQNVVDTVMRSGNTGTKVLWLQQMLCDLGYLQEKDLTGTYGSGTKQAVISIQKEKLGRTSASGIADRETVQKVEAMWNELQFETDDTWLVDE